MRQQVSDRAMDTPSDTTLFFAALMICLAALSLSLGLGWLLLRYIAQV